MRVLHVIESMGRGGAERNFATLLPSLSALGVENVVATLWSGHAYDEVLERHTTHHDFQLPRPGPAFSTVPGLIKLAREADAVHTQLAWADIVGRIAAVAAGKPSLTTMHTTQYDGDNVARLPRRARLHTHLIQAMDAAMARTTRRLFAVSPSVRASYARALRLDPARIELAPNVIDPEVFDPDRQPPRAELRARYGMASDELAVISVGRLIPSKRQEDAIRAVAALGRQVPVRLYLAGTGPDEASLRQLAGQLGAPVAFLGDRGDVPQLLHASDVFVFPTLFEGMPMALLEAMAMAKPAVCSDLVEIRQLGREAVVYVQPQDAAAIERELRALASDPARRAQLGQMARNEVRAFADPRAAARRFVTVVEELLVRRR
jgi:glycosyltransferase involved in cell wall biosynthesis